MLRKSGIVLAALVTLVMTVGLVAAASPDFIKNDTSISRDGNTLTVSGKEAGLGDEEQVHIVLSADALCINPGSKHPKAENKESVSDAGDFPVQNGKADFTLSVTASFQPNCSPPMTVVFTNVTLTDTTNGISISFSGTF